MIFVGTMNLTRTRDQGNFYCPTCGGNQPYRLRSRRPFLTVYFIPTVPVGPAESFVQCGHCQDCWDQSVLQMQRQHHEIADEESFCQQALRAAVLVVLADGVTTENEIAALQKIGITLTSSEFDREELGQLCSAALENGIKAKNYVLTVSRGWNHDQRIRALQAMFFAATAEGSMGQPQTELLAEMRDLLDLSDREYQAAIEEAVAMDLD